MSEPITKPRVSAAAKIVLVLAAAAVLLAVFAQAAPGSKFFFPLVSLWCNLALFGLVLVVLRLAKALRVPVERLLPTEPESKKRRCAS